MRIKIAREWRGMEQHDLAEATGISRSTVSNYESGATTRLKPLYLQQMALALGVPLVWLQTGAIPGGGDGENQFYRLNGHADGFAEILPFRLRPTG